MRQRRALQQCVVGVALFVLFALAGCSDGAEVFAGATLDQAQAPTAVATTAPAVLATPTEPATPPPSPVPSPTPLVIVEPTVEPTAVPTSESQPPVSTATAIPDVATATAGPQAAATVVPTSVPVTGSQQVLAANGGEVFTLNCARCHGENGLGSAQYSAGLIGVGSQYSTAGMITELTTGHPVTFGFADRLSSEEIASVVAYLKSVFP